MDEPRRGYNLCRQRAVGRDTLARIVGKSCSIDLRIDDTREELRGRPYDLVGVAGGWKHMTRPVYANAIRTPVGGSARRRPLAVGGAGADVHRLLPTDHPRGTVLFLWQGDQPRSDRQSARCRPDHLRFPTSGAPYTYITTREFLLEFGLDTRRDLPDFEALEDAGLFSKEKLLAGDIMPAFPDSDMNHADVAIDE